MSQPPNNSLTTYYNWHLSRDDHTMCAHHYYGTVKFQEQRSDDGKKTTVRIFHGENKFVDYSDMTLTTLPLVAHDNTSELVIANGVTVSMRIPPRELAKWLTFMGTCL